MLKALIIEDEDNSKLVLRTFIQNYCKDIKIIGEVGSIREAIHSIEHKKPNLIFLDIELEDGNGIQVLDHFKNPKFASILVTGYDQYAIDAIKRNALDYILKPIIIKELVTAVEKAKIKVKELLLLNEIEVAIENKKTVENKIILPFKNKQLKVVNPTNILFIEAQSQYTKWHLKNEPSFIIRKGLSELEEMLPNSFFRTHKSYIVNMDSITFIDKGRGGFIEIDSIKIPISLRRKKEFISQVKAF